MRFILDDPNDVIQECLFKGYFFEQAELEKIIHYIKPKSVIIDVGANIGNHSIFFDKFYNPKTIYAIEPIDRAYKMLLQNIALNYCHTVNVDYIGLALSDSRGYCKVDKIYSDNLGGTTLKKSHKGITTVTGDSIFLNIHVDFIKIDVEGMEINVLNGFEKTINKYKPIIFIEVCSNLEQEFYCWINKFNYFIVECMTSNIWYKNFLIKSKEQS